MRLGFPLAIILVSMWAVLAFAGSAVAQEEYWPGMNALDDSGFASADQVTAAVGSYQIEVVCPSARLDGPFRQRGARVTIQNGTGYENKAVLSTLLLEALRRAWGECRMAHSIGVSHEMVDYVVGFIDVYGPSSDTGQTALLVRANDYSDVFRRWDSVSDMVAIARQQAATAEQQRQADELAATRAQQQALVQAEEQAASAQRSAEWNTRWSNIWRTIKTLFWIGIGLFIVTWLSKRRYAIARWYYFTFHPHPAQHAIQTAIDTGALLNGAQLAAMLGETPPGTEVFRQVRFEQSSRLIAAMETATRYRLKQLQEKAAEQYEHAAVQQAQAALAQAAIALEQAKAFLNASNGSASR